MSGDMVSEQISVPSRQGHLEAVSGNPDMAEITNMMETSTNDLPIQHMPVSVMQSGLMASASSSLTSQHVDTSNVLMGVSDPMSFSFVPQFVSCQPFSLMDSQSSTPQLQPSVAHQYPSGGSIAAFSSSGSTQLAGKRKSPLESVPNGSAPQKLDVSNKRVSQMQHRPWLQQLSPASNGSVHFPTSSLSPMMQHVPMLSKKAVQMESVSSNAAKQLTNKKQPVPSQVSKKTQNEGNESVRSKMRESLAAALAQAQQEDDCIAGEKGSQTKDVDNFATTQENSESVEPVTAAAIGTPAVEVATYALSSGDENSGQKDSAGRIVLHETSDDTQMKDANQSDEQKSEFDEVFPRDDVPFSDSIFANDELLQGNGLSWVLESVSDLGEAKDVETDAAPKSGDEINERTDGEKPFQDPELLASEIEVELFNLFGGVNKKYKEKGRSLLFNLKDKNNPELRKRVISGEIPPARLCSMTAEELASKELSQWRQAKAEEMAEMVVLRDTDIDVRQLVRKTHKGEFQVEIDPVDSGAVDVSASVSSRSSQPRPKNKGKKESSHPVKSLKKDDSQDKIAQGNQGKSCTITIPSNEGTDPMQGLSMDDEMKDVGFLPPIVSLDEFMESLNSEPPFESPQEDAGKEASVHKKSDSESVSSHQFPKEPSERDSPNSKPDKSNLVSPKPDASVLSIDDVSKPENRDDVASIKGEKVWDGILQLSSSSVVPVTGIYKSGERAQTREWPTLVEVKGRVRVSAFAKFLKELPLSRSRALMVMCLVCKDGVSESQRGNLYEAAESYVADERVGYSEPTSGMELYLCPPRGQTLDMIGKIISNDQLEEVKRLDVGLIGVVVWRRAVASSPRPRDKPGFKRHHSSSGSGKSSVINAMNSGRAVASSMVGSHGVTANDDGNDDDVPPGFGPGSAARDEDDDLPEFNFDSSSRPVSSPRPQSRSMHQVRELIHKYGKSVTGGSNQGIQPWNNNDDEDDDDMPEWQPRAPSHHPVPPPTSLQPPPGFGAEMDPRQVHSRTVVRPPIHTQQPLPPPPRSGDGWWANQNAVAEQPYGHAGPRNRGF
ncbi:PREDICTED: uncharacterized protein LOC104815043 isoform X1 [Tarenaya hassleriana]|uniref:uncharacterized protein LOC104815043 isoform X1 n=1 Tax=Tarenaya hassleriana TaxID=28532 RepID=UPI00053C63F2|nr:PREDICTED: uncharacterized protein LOC104815043 isoform X1 [Tarenaya hassleriana]XP_010541635.1 PREDICTED: uncharacterized protein LOC104815043 isoform X2 [Tarenaya hassleriana]XP_010541636.1 PREDICTED: uncharacterized protein LOC104815043 isoform X1 [Tarenaya hassleriana]